jgi:hypothetical protein
MTNAVARRFVAVAVPSIVPAKRRWTALFLPHASLPLWPFSPDNLPPGRFSPDQLPDQLRAAARPGQHAQRFRI